MKNFAIAFLTLFLFVSQNSYSMHRWVSAPNAVPNNGVKSDPLVGAFGGTGCTRHWDVMDFKDYIYSGPADVCANFALVSPVHSKWIDRGTSTKNPDITSHPIEGDAILKKRNCAAATSYELWQYPVCGGAGHIVATCDEDGRALSREVFESCYGAQ